MTRQRREQLIRVAREYDALIVNTPSNSERLVALTTEPDK